MSRSVEPVDEPDASESFKVFEAGGEFVENLHGTFRATGRTGLYRCSCSMLKRGMNDADRL